MVEVIDEEEAKQEQKGLSASEDSGQPAEPPDLASRPLETDEHPDAGTGARPLYKRPAILAAAALVLVIGAIIGVRYWLYARAHESTDDAFLTATSFRSARRLPVTLRRFMLATTSKYKPVT